MALKKQMTTDVRLVGQVQVGAYIRVTHVAGSKSEVTANAAFHKDGAEGEMFQSCAYTFKPSMDGGNFIDQAYEHLKSLPEFAGAEDS